MRAAARRGLEYYEQGLGGDGLVERTIREARAMANGSVTAEKWSRIAAWIARHLVDLDAPAADPENEAYPSPVLSLTFFGVQARQRGPQSERWPMLRVSLVELKPRMKEEPEERV
jgi:hypothetical protein